MIVWVVAVVDAGQGKSCQPRPQFLKGGKDMIQFFIFLSSVCIWNFEYGYKNLIVSPMYKHEFQVPEPNYTVREPVCFQTARISTSPIAQEGETAYRVIPGSATICQIIGEHTWQKLSPCELSYRWELRFWSDSSCPIQVCKFCGLKRKKITTERWEEIP